MDERIARYEADLARHGSIQFAPVLPQHDGGTGDRWSATWAPSRDALVDHDASAPTLLEALVYLAYGLGEEVLELRAKAAERRAGRGS